MPKLLGASLTDKERAKVTSRHTDINFEFADADDQHEKEQEADEDDDITPTTRETGSYACIDQCLFDYCILCNLKSNISLHILLQLTFFYQ